MKYNTHILSALFIGATLATSPCLATNKEAAQQILNKEFDQCSNWSPIEFSLTKPYKELLSRPKGPEIRTGIFCLNNKKIAYEIEFWVIDWCEILPAEIRILIPFKYITGVLKIDDTRIPFSIKKHFNIKVN